MTYTPFNAKNQKSINYLFDHDIEFTRNPQEADIFLINRFPNKKCIFPDVKKRWQMRQQNISSRPVLLWTHEPHYDRHFTSEVRPSLLLAKVHIMNVYTRNIYFSNYMYVSKPQEPLSLIKDIETSVFAKKTIAFLATYVSNPWLKTLIKNGKDLNLTGIRQKLALEGYQRGLVDIYGRGWPEGISLENSRKGNWHGRKSEILEPYLFNICLENTNYNYYCTEKIWDAIRSKCLPIYYGKGNKIYEDFSQDSLIDIANFTNPILVFDYIKNMSKEEYITRLNKCIESYNNLININLEEKQYLKMLDEIIQKIRCIVNA